MISGVYWLFEPKRIDLTVFLRSLTAFTEDSDVLVLDGGVSDDELRSYVKERESPTKPDYREPRKGQFIKLVPPFVEFYTDERLYMQARAEYIEGLAQLSERRAEPEVCSDLYVYRDGQVLLEFYDVPSGIIAIAASVPEAVVSESAKIIGREYSLCK